MTTAANVVFRVPNTEEGQWFVNFARQCVNRDRYAEVARVRRGSHDQGKNVTPEDTEWFAIYLRENSAVAWRERKAEFESAKKIAQRIFERRLDHARRDMEDAKAEAESYRENWHREVGNLDAARRLTFGWQIAAAILGAFSVSLAGLLLFQIAP